MISNSQSDIISRIYEQRHYHARDLLAKRTEEVISVQPAIEEINDKIIDNSMRAARMSLLASDESALTELKLTNEALIDTKRQLIVKAGFPADYLENIYECPECNDTGVIRDRDGIIISKCRCYIRTVIDTFYMTPERRELLAKECFGNFDDSLYSSEESYKGSGLSCYQIMESSFANATSFCKSFDTEFKNLYISGNTGTGKTFLANCIAGYLTDRAHSVLYMSALDFFEYCRKNTFANGYEAKATEDDLDFIYTAECLILDDLGAENSSKFTNSQLFNLIEKRLLKRLPTVITSNLSPNDLKERYSERISSRILAYYQLLTMPGDDNRIKQ